MIERVLGSGGFGMTYLAKDARLGRQVVIKENLPVQFCFRDPGSLTVRPRNSAGSDAGNFAWSLENFEKEAEMLASLNHPGIVRVLRSFEAFGTAFFVMPFVDGTALDEQIRHRQEGGNAFTEDELTGLLWRMLDALEYLHTCGIYHRDIKPANLLITYDGIPVLIDFGSARQQIGERSLTVIESAGYTPFEQLQSRGKIGPWSDLYALGATLYKAITGETPQKAADRIMDDPMIPLASQNELLGRYSRRFLETIDRVMAPQVEVRYGNAAAWRDALSGSENSSPETVHRPGPGSGETKAASSQSAVKRTKRVILTPDISSEESSIITAKGVRMLEQRKRSSLIRWIVGAVVSLIIAFVALQYSPMRIESARSLFSGAFLTNFLDAGMAGAKAGEERTFEGVKMVWCPAGDFLIGSPERESGRQEDETQHPVALTHGFWLAKTECTQSQWEPVMGGNPSNFRGGDLPVEQVSWEDAQAFLRKMNEQHPLSSGWQWSLPTEAQWEYACRAGANGPFGGIELDDTGWYLFNSASRTNPAGGKTANAWGLHDMHGNVYEWCADWYGNYPGSATTDPTGAGSGATRVLRGGSWLSSIENCRSAERLDLTPDNRDITLGFRPVAVPPGE